MGSGSPRLPASTRLRLRSRSSATSSRMSIILSISSVLSFLSFLTTVLALARVGAAAFASNENRFQAHQLQQSHLGGSVEKGHQTHPHPHNVTKVGLDSDSEKGAEDVESRLKELRAFIAGRQMPKLSSGWSALRKPRITFPPCKSRRSCFMRSIV